MEDQTAFINTLKTIAGQKHVLTGDVKTRRYRYGYRGDHGTVLAVVRPGSLHELWQVTQACVAADKIILMQAANTGLTGGSTPDGDNYDRDIVIISTLRLDTIHLLDGGQQVVCLPGATLYQLEKQLAPLDRDPHSVIGSSCIGASVIGGICNNSGGTLIQRGPAYTEYALYARITDSGDLELLNNLGIDLGDTPEEILACLETGRFDDSAVTDYSAPASDQDYHRHIRQIEALTPARYNADPRRLHEASGCAGKIIVFAVRLDSFPKPDKTQLFYIGTNDTSQLTKLRRDILKNFQHLPVSAEYIHAEAYDMAARYGKDVFLAIYHMGTTFLPLFYTLKSRFDGLFSKFTKRKLSDRILQIFADIWPAHLPLRMTDFRKKYDHHLLLEMAGEGIAEAEAYLQALCKDGRISFFACDKLEAKKAFLQRFVVAAAPVRYAALYPEKTAGVLALDIALPRNETDWFETLPAPIEVKLRNKVYYGHFFCHVFHQDYLVEAGHDIQTVKADMLKLLDTRGAEYPAEHNVGHQYVAKDSLKDFYKTLDPCNVCNPGIGKTSKKRNWA